MQSKIALSRGAAHIALGHAKHSVRLLRRAWARVEEQWRRRTSSTSGYPLDSEISALADGVSKMNISVASIPEDLTASLPGLQPYLWPFIIPLFRALEYLSSVYAYHGMYQETIYYAEQGYKLAQDVKSDSHQAMAAATMAITMMKAGLLENGSEMLMKSKQLSSAVQSDCNAATLAYCTGKMHGILGDEAAELVSYDLAERILAKLLDVNQDGPRTAEVSINTIEASMANISISKTRATTKRPPASRTKVPPKTNPKTKKVISRAKTPTLDVPPSAVEDCSNIVSLQATIFRAKAHVLNRMKRFAEVQGLLNKAAGSVRTQIEIVDQKLSMAKQLLFESLEFMIADPVYSVLQDSTISFPSVSGNLKSEIPGDRTSVAKLSPPKRAGASKSGRGVTRAKAASSSDSCFEKLYQAQENLLEAHSIAVTAAPLALIHTISALLNSVSILLSASGHSKGTSILTPGFASCTIGRLRDFLRKLMTDQYRNCTYHCNPPRA